MQFLSIKKNVRTMHFLFVFKILFEKKGGGIFGDHNLPSGDQKFILDRQLAPVLKSYFRTLFDLLGVFLLDHNTTHEREYVSPKLCQSPRFVLFT